MAESGLTTPWSLLDDAGGALAIGAVMHAAAWHTISRMSGGALAEGDLLRLFDQLRWDDRLDEPTAAMLGRAYV